MLGDNVPTRRVESTISRPGALPRQRARSGVAHTRGRVSDPSRHGDCRVHHGHRDRAHTRGVSAPVTTAAYAPGVGPNDALRRNDARDAIGEIIHRCRSCCHRGDHPVHGPSRLDQDLVAGRDSAANFPLALGVRRGGVEVIDSQSGDLGVRSVLLRIACAARVTRALIVTTGLPVPSREPVR
jgi:hypothetical protein